MYSSLYKICAGDTGAIRWLCPIAVLLPMGFYQSSTYCMTELQVFDFTFVTGTEGHYPENRVHVGMTYNILVILPHILPTALSTFKHQSVSRFLYPPERKTEQYFIQQKSTSIFSFNPQNPTDSQEAKIVPPVVTKTTSAYRSVETT